MFLYQRAPTEQSKGKPILFVPCQDWWAGWAPSPTACVPLGLAWLETLTSLDYLLIHFFPNLWWDSHMGCGICEPQITLIWKEHFVKHAEDISVVGFECLHSHMPMYNIASQKNMFEIIVLINLWRVWLLSYRQIYAIFAFVCYICETSIIFPRCKWSHFCCFPCDTVPCSFLLRKFQKEKQFVRMTRKWLLICVHHSNLTHRKRLSWDSQILIPTEFQAVQILKKNHIDQFDHKDSNSAQVNWEVRFSAITSGEEGDKRTQWLFINNMGTSFKVRALGYRLED